MWPEKVINRNLTYWEKAVGLTFNPGDNPKVNEIKKFYANIIDMLNNEREDLKNMGEKPENQNRIEKIRLLSVAITEAQTAQMWAVKWVTYNS